MKKLNDTAMMFAENALKDYHTAEDRMKHILVIIDNYEFAYSEYDMDGENLEIKTYKFGYVDLYSYYTDDKNKIHIIAMVDGNKVELDDYDYDRMSVYFQMLNRITADNAKQED